MTEPIPICEGEKKAALACQLGLNAIAVSGLWCWRQRTDKGDRLTIPTLDLITWSGRTPG